MFYKNIVLNRRLKPLHITKTPWPSGQYPGHTPEPFWPMCNNTCTYTDTLKSSLNPLSTFPNNAMPHNPYIIPSFVPLAFHTLENPKPSLRSDLEREKEESLEFLPSSKVTSTHFYNFLVVLITNVIIFKDIVSSFCTHFHTKPRHVFKGP